MRWYKADLHIHTVLSPCAELSMGPQDIVRQALDNSLDVIAITDHNSAENAAAVIKAAEDKALTVFAGMEVYTREEAHVICLFPNAEADLIFQQVIYEHLAEGENDPDWFGPQYIVDAKENVIGECKRLLAMPTNLHVHQIASFVLDLGGIIFPAHIDRKANSLLRVLGFIPNDLPFDAVEIAQPYDDAVKQIGFLKKSPYAVLRSSDAHMIEQVGTKATFLKMEDISFAELKSALKREKGRDVALQINEPRHEFEKSEL